ncbi:hypothetical protein GCM10009744_22730 [Kribbella alba]|uniref:Alpha/beta hydrolase n=1 Tax=Kribbella alba TaxID=190197 RepID=A0ABP4R2N1_9ACTN
MKPRGGCHRSPSSANDGRSPYSGRSGTALRSSSSRTAAICSPSAEVEGHEVLYWEIRPVDAPILLLLQGFPTASHMFRELIPMLADKYHLVTPDDRGRELPSHLADLG